MENDTTVHIKAYASEVDPNELVRMLKEKVEAIEREMRHQNAEWRSQIAALQRVIEICEGENPPLAVSSNTRKSSLSGRLRSFAIKEIERAGRPLHRNEILRRAFAAGLSIDAKDPAKFLTRVLWRTKELVNDGDGYHLISHKKDSI